MAQRTSLRIKRMSSLLLGFPSSVLHLYFTHFNTRCLQLPLLSIFSFSLSVSCLHVSSTQRLSREYQLLSPFRLDFPPLLPHLLLPIFLLNLGLPLSPSQIRRSRIRVQRPSSLWIQLRQ